MFQLLLLFILAFFQTITSLTSSMPVIGLNIQFSVKAERRVELLELLKEDEKQTLGTEPGALQFVVGENINDPNMICLHEQYKSKEDLGFHNTTPHFAKVAKFFESHPFTQDPVINIYACKHEPKRIENRPAFCLNVESCIKAEFRDNFLELMMSHQVNSQAEPGCLQFDWGESVDGGSSFYIHEQYADKKGYDAHEVTAHFTKFGVFNVKEPYAKPQVVNFFKTFIW